MFFKYYKAYYEWVARELTKLDWRSTTAEDPSQAMLIVIMLLAPFIPMFAIVWLLPLTSGTRIGIGSIIIVLFMIILPLSMAYKLHKDQKQKIK